MQPLITKFPADGHADQYGGGKASGKADDLDDRPDLVSGNVPVGCDKKIPEHLLQLL